MKKHLLFITSGLFVLGGMFAQTADKCATMPVYQARLQNPISSANFKAADVAAQNWLSNPINKRKASQKTNSIINIPVVVHVVYKNAVQNIPDTQIVRQIQILNECFRLQNSNFSATRPIFDSIGADTEIQFCLATIDPQGNPTTGIIRKSAPTSANFDPILNMDKVKSSATNGDDPWPNTQYLNIWVCDMSIFGFTFVLGYATFPGETAALDGIVIQSEYFGYGASSLAPNNLGRTTVHEVGHFFGMRHIWADDDGGAAALECDSTDFVDDTPNQGAKSASDCNVAINSCSSEMPYWSTIDPPDMVENYMDYSSDGCMTLFTKGQKARMYSYLNTSPARIAIKTSPAACNDVGVKELTTNFNDYVFTFPNPTNDILNINITKFTPANLKCEIYNSHGQVVKTIAQLDFHNSINVDNLSNGLYVVKVYSAELAAVKKITILR
ncbi:MAG: T9SS type A sorting domain-containing protein [Bacteroidia bacterium]|nr:T9SS type A sorting domain-containing protein [Bacteroidia bacterium]